MTASRTSFQNLYIHVPFCVRKCDYCAFYSEETHPENIRRWLTRLETDLRKYEPHLQSLHTLYLGGGTPTALEENELAQLFTLLKRHVKVSGEITSECNPGTLSEKKADILASFVNRVSLGVQSFARHELDAIGRHPGNGPNDVSSALTLLRNAGIDNLGLDLIYAIPGQTLAQWRKTIEQACTETPRHISAYALTVEENTPLAHRLHPDLRIEEELAHDMWLLAGETLAAYGLPRYEISNYAAPGFGAKHNLNVWYGETYLGLGPSAASFDGENRWTEVSDLHRWVVHEPPEADSVSPRLRARELFIMGLRTVEGWRKERFSRTRFKIQWEEILSDTKKLVEDGLLHVSEEHDTVRATPLGLSFWNEVAERLLD